MEDPSVMSALDRIAEGVIGLMEAIKTAHIGVPDPPNLTVKDVADLLNCAQDTIRTAVHREGDPIPVCHVGALLRFRRSAVIEWANRQKPKDRPYREEKPVQPTIGTVTGIGVRKSKRRAMG